MEALPKLTPQEMQTAAAPLNTESNLCPMLAPSWVRDAVFYEIFPDRFFRAPESGRLPGALAWSAAPTGKSVFGGNLAGILKKIDYLQALGVTAVYLTPVFSSSSNHKYNARDYMRIDEKFGDERTFATLVTACHARKMRIILDGVFNHTGTDFFAFEDLKRYGEHSRYRHWYHVKSFPIVSSPEPSYECWWDIGSLPQLNTSNPEVKEYLFSVTRYWMQFGIDGWRLDVPNEIAPAFWIEWRRLVKSINPNAYIVGEIWHDASKWLQGDQFDSVMNYVLRDACVNLFAHHVISVSTFDRILAHQRETYPAGAVPSLLNLLGSHDTERFMTLCRGSRNAVQLAMLFLMTYPGAPMLYYGDEIGLRGGKDPACRGTMRWKAGEQNSALLQFVRDAVHLRRTHEVLRSGEFTTLIHDDRRNVYAYLRTSADRQALVVLNNGRNAASVRFKPSMLEATAWSQAWPILPAGKKIRAGNVPLSDGPVRVPALQGRVFIGKRV